MASPRSSAVPTSSITITSSGGRQKNVTQRPRSGTQGASSSGGTQQRDKQLQQLRQQRIQQLQERKRQQQKVEQHQQQQKYHSQQTHHEEPEQEEEVEEEQDPSLTASPPPLAHQEPELEEPEPKEELEPPPPPQPEPAVVEPPVTQLAQHTSVYGTLAPTMPISKSEQVRKTYVNVHKQNNSVINNRVYILYIYQYLRY